MRAYTSLARRALYPLAGLVTSETIIWFGIPAILTRALTPSDWGRYSILVSLAALPMVLVFASSVEDSTLARFMAERRARTAPDQPAGRGDERRIYSAMMCIWCGSSAIALLLVWLLSPALCARYRVPDLSAWLWLAALPTLVLMPMVNHFLASVQGYQRIRRWAFGRGVSTLTAFAVLAIFAAAGQLTSLPRTISVIALAWLAALTVSMAVARRPLGRLRPDRPDRETLRLLMRFLLTTLAAPISGATVALLLPYLLTRHAGAVAVGHYFLGRSVLVFLGLAHAAIMVPLLPEWAHLYERRDGRALLRSFRDTRTLLVGVGVAYAGLFFIARQHLVGLLFGEAMTPATPPVLAMVAAGPLLLAGWLGGSCCVLGKRPQVIAAANVVWATFVAVASVLLVPRYGALGAAFGWFAGYVVFFWVYVLGLRPFFRQLRAWEAQQDARDGNDAAPPTPAPPFE